MLGGCLGTWKPDDLMVLSARFFHEIFFLCRDLILINLQNIILCSRYYVNITVGFIMISKGLWVETE